MRNAWDLVARWFTPRVATRGICGVLIVMGLAGVAAGGLVPSLAVAKTPGKTYCFLRVCHRVLTLGETRARVGKRSTVVASYYDDCRRDRFNPCGLTSSGSVFRPHHADNAASPIYPNGTKLLVFNPRNGKAAVVRVDNAGPYWRRRTLDVSRAAAERLGFRKTGVARLIVQVLKAPTAGEARYRRKRRYKPVKGYLGQFGGVKAAVIAAGYGARVERALAKRMPIGDDPMWARQAALATPVLPVMVAPEPAPLPVKPAPAFRQKIQMLAKAARQRRLARMRAERAEARKVALAKARAAEKDAVAERRRLAAVAEKKKVAARTKAAARGNVATAKPAPQKRQQVAASKPVQTEKDKAGAGSQNAAAREQPASVRPPVPTAPPQAQAPRSRTVWRREIVGVPQNSS